MPLGEITKLVETFQREGVREAVIVGQVKHQQIFSSIRPDWKLARLSPAHPVRHADSMIGGVTTFLAREGITLLQSTSLLEPLLARPGVLTRRPPTDQEQTNITYGWALAHHLARVDVGQTVVIANATCVAVEAMDGTDATILRAGALMKSLCGESTVSSCALTVVKGAKAHQEMRFDVPVIGVATIEAMIRAGATCLSVEAGRTLLFDREALLQRAAEADIAIQGIGTRD